MLFLKDRTRSNRQNLQWVLTEYNNEIYILSNSGVGTLTVLCAFSAWDCLNRGYLTPGGAEIRC